MNHQHQLLQSRTTNHSNKNNTASATAVTSPAAEQMPSYAVLLDAYQREKVRNQMYAVAMPTMHQQQQPNTAMMLAVLRNEAARTAHIQQAMFASCHDPFLVAAAASSYGRDANLLSSKLTTGSNTAAACTTAARKNKDKSCSSTTTTIDPALLSWIAANQSLNGVPAIPSSLFSATPPTPSAAASNASLLAMIQQAKQKVVDAGDEAAAAASETSSVTSSTIGEDHDAAIATTSLAAAESSSLLTKNSRKSTAKNASFVEAQPDDVLFGKGRTKYCGNRNLQRLIENLMGVYEAATKQQKKELADMAVSKISSAGGRFLKLDDESQRWKEVSKEEAHKKVAHAFRNLRRRNK